MGNQLTGIAPSQILPVEQYLTDVPQFHFIENLGSTRFFKVAKAKSKEGVVVVKVFVIHDPSLPLKAYKEKLEDIYNRLQDATNCLPFQSAKQSDRAALLIRQYVKYSLYDRISTRPFLNAVEKKWIAYQILCAVNQCHKLNVCHGDIKSENVMVTSWNWVLFTDFASFKPTYLPEDNPADFSYFFDTSRRRTCCIAPERFVESSWRTVDPTKDMSNLDLTASEVKKGDLTPSMDVFSAGCVIAELFMEGTSPFDLSQLLAYRAGEYTPSKLLNNIDDQHIRELVRHMMQKDPTLRFSAERYLMEQRGKAFPDYFYTFLGLYCQRFAQIPILYSDERIVRLKRDFELILHNVPDDITESPLVIIISLVTSSVRQLLYCNSKLIALDLMYSLSKSVAADIVLDRLIPYMLHMISDSFPAVRCEAIRTVTKCLSAIKTVPASDANIFPEYVLPQMSHLVQDPVTMVRVTYAENIAALADTALRFLEIVQRNASDTTAESLPAQDASQIKASYDAELQALHELIQSKVVTLLSDPDNIVKRTLLENGIKQLCVFFGRQKANDILLSHMITFLNDKNDWHLRGAFFDNIVGVAEYVGWQSSVIMKPLLQQGLSDSEESVIVKALDALAKITEHGLLQKSVVRELLTDAVQFLVHPNVWIRQSCVGFVAAVSRKLDVADVHCHLLPSAAPFLAHPVIQVDQEVVLLSSLKEPIPRPIYDHIVKSVLFDALLECLKNRSLRRSIARHRHDPVYAEVDDNLALLLRKLASQGMTADVEDQIAAMSDFLLKLHRVRAGTTIEVDIYNDDAMSQRPGVVNLQALKLSNICREVDLNRCEGKLLDPTTSSARRTLRRKTNSPDSPSQLMNEDWKQMFGAAPIDRASLALATKSKSPSPVAAGSVVSRSATDQRLMTSSTASDSSEPSTLGTAGSQQLSASGGIADSTLTVLSGSTISVARRAADVEQKVSEAPCKHEHRLLQHRIVEQFHRDQAMSELMENSGTWADSSRLLHSAWKPRGLLVAHLHEHRGAVNRIRVSDDQQYFATCSNDGAVKLWEASRLDSKSIVNRSRHTYSKQGGQIKTITFCDSAQSIAAASDCGAIHVFRVESGSNRVSVLHTRNLDVNSDGLVVDMLYFDNGSQNVVAYTTVNGLIVGWDLRSQKLAWKLQNNPKLGLVTSFDVHQQLCWLALGTSKGAHICWDMRFQLPITTVTHPTGTCVRRLIVNPSAQSSVISSVQGNNEVSVWDMETSARQKTLWASSAPPLSQTQTSKHCVNGLYIGQSDRNQFLLTAGSDMRIRYWDLNYAANSRIVVNAATDPVHSSPTVSYRSRLIEGTEVIQETYGKARSPPGDERAIAERPAVGHHDIITDIAVCRSTQCFIITSSRDGMVKVWK